MSYIYDNLGNSSSPVARNKQGTSTGKCGVNNEPDESISSDNVFMLSALISETVCVIPTFNRTGITVLATISPDLPLFVEAAVIQI